MKTNKRISKKDKIILHNQIEDIIMPKTTPFTAYDITKEIAKKYIKNMDKITLNDFMRFGNHTHTVIGKMEARGNIKFLKESDSYSPVKKKLFTVVR